MDFVDSSALGILLAIGLYASSIFSKSFPFTKENHPEEFRMFVILVCVVVFFSLLISGFNIFVLLLNYAAIRKFEKELNIDLWNEGKTRG